MLDGLKVVTVRHRTVRDVKLIRLPAHGTCSSSVSGSRRCCREVAGGLSGKGQCSAASKPSYIAVLRTACVG